MSHYDPIALMFGGMEKLGPGDDGHTLRVLRMLPQRPFQLVVDAGCGAGRQTLVLARELGVMVHAVDTNGEFLDNLNQRAKGMRIDIRTHCMSMQDIPEVFGQIGLLWSEGAAYNIGFANALSTWMRAIVPGGFAVVSELSWLREIAPDEVKEYFRSAYPDMRSVDHNIAVAEAAGYQVIATHTLPRHTWVDGYYDILAPRAKSLLAHPDQSVRDFAAETIKEIEIFEKSGDSYGYVFFVLQRS